MSNTGNNDEIDEIRKEKLEELQSRAESPDEPVNVQGKDHLEDLLEKHSTVLVDFYADWCGPCKMIAPTVAEIAAETDAAVLKVDIDAHQNLASEYQVQGVPTLYLFKDGDVAERMVGVQDKAALIQKIESIA